MALEGMGGRTATRRGSGGSFSGAGRVAGATVAKSAPVAPVAAPITSYSPSYDDGGSVGGYSAPVAPPPRRSLADVIASDFGLRQQQEENARREGEFDLETGRLRGETEREQTVRRGELQTDLGDMSLDSSEDLAGRGLLNSGGLFLNQDRINAEGSKRENSIAELLTSLLADRGSGRTQLQAQGRNAYNERMNSLTSDYARGAIN
jgi:hypothetical protein